VSLHSKRYATDAEAFVVGLGNREHEEAKPQDEYSEADPECGFHEILRGTMPALPANPKVADATPEANRLQHPNSNSNYYDDVQNRLDAGSHRDVAIDEIKGHPYDDECNNEVY
jgi:hypothetical protein